MPSVVGTISKGAVFDSVVNAADVGAVNSLTEKVTPVGADLLILADSADSYARKKLQITNLPSGSGGIAEELAIAYSIAL